MDSKDAPGIPRKVKFAPRAPPRRVPKAEVKTEVLQNADADQAQAKNLLRRFNESAMKAKHKVERKVSASQIAFGYGGESTSTKSYGGIPRGGSSVNVSQNSAFGGMREKEYKEPWDYYSNYPVTLPLRRPYSGNPELLDEVEFGVTSVSRTYNENASNPATELGLLEENLEASMFFVNLPPTLPIITQSATARGQNVDVNSKPPGGSKDVEKPCKLNELPSGFMGKMLVYKSGAIKLKLGHTLYDVSPGMTCTFAQDVVAINTAQKHCCAIGEISKHVVITPDIDAILDNLSDL
ncbi:DNA-directed RNA polymerase III subunit RPC4, partial [Mucuna pruriens]